MFSSCLTPLPPLPVLDMARRKKKYLRRELSTNPAVHIPYIVTLSLTVFTSPTTKN